MSLRRICRVSWGLALPLATLSILAPSASAAILRVHASAPGAVQDGAAWDTAFLTVQAAVSAAASGDEIWVARGSYTGPIAVNRPLALYGGFAGTETSRAQRDFRANASTLRGEGADAAITLGDVSGTYLLDGFTVQGAEPAADTGIVIAGSAAGTVANCHLSGWRIAVEQRSLQPGSVLNSVIRHSGTGILGAGRTLTIASNVIAFNGTGVSSPGTSQIVVNNTFVSNKTGVDVTSTTGAYTNNLMAYNGVGFAGGAFNVRNACVWGNGADAAGPNLVIGANGNIKAAPRLTMPAVGEFHLLPDSPCINAGTNVGVVSSWTDMDGQPRILNGTADIGADESDGSTIPVVSRTVRVKPDGDDENDGGSWADAKRSIQSAHDALWGHGGEIWVAGGIYRQTAEIYTAVSLVGGFGGTETDRAMRQGAKTILTADADASILTLNCPIGPARVEGLEFRDAYAGVLCLAGSSRIANNVVAGNVYGIEVQSGSPELVNNTLLANDVAIRADSGAPVVKNCLVAYNRVGVSAAAGGAATVTVTHSGLFGNGAAVENLPTPDPGLGNLDADPLLASVRYGDVHLQPGSPMIDAGDNDAVLPEDRDTDGQPRIAGARVDIGADESDGALRTVVPRVVRVAGTGNDAADGAAWSAAKRTLQAAIDEAACEGGEVWVAGGAYAPARLRAFTYLYGGFAGTETTREGRDPSVHISAIASPDTTPAVAASGAYQASALDGFTIRDSIVGVGLASASPEVCNNSFTANQVAFEASGGAPVVQRNSLLYNFDGLRHLGGTPRIAANRFRGNGGSAISVWDAAPDIRNNAILGSGSAGLYLAGCAGQVVGNTLMANATGISTAHTTAAVANNLIAYNMVGVDALQSGGLTFASNGFWENRTPFRGVAGPIGQNGNIEADPMLASAPYGNAHLQPASPLRGAGNAAFVRPADTDADGRPRALGANPDIGAYASDGTTWAVSPTVVRVHPDGDDANDGSDWDHAVKTLSAAARRASASGGEVWAARGTYTEHIPSAPFAYLYGGFAGTETNRQGRDIAVNPTAITDAGLLPLVKARGGYTFYALDGFTLRNAVRGVSTMGSAASVRHNTFDQLGSTLADTEGAVEFAWNTIRLSATPAGESAVATIRSDARILNNVIAHDSSIGYSPGFGVSLTDGAPLVANNVIAHYLTGVQIRRSAATVVNNTFVRNAEGIGLDITEPRIPTLANNIIHSLYLGVQRTGGTAMPIFRSNDVFAQTRYQNMPDQTGLFGNISSDPLFREQPGAFMSKADLRLRFASPATDAGDDAYVVPGWPSLDGGPRIAGLRVDMGAYESIYARPTAADVAAALRIAGGLSPATAADMERLNVQAGPLLDIWDALFIARVFAESF